MSAWHEISAWEGVSPRYLTPLSLVHADRPTWRAPWPLFLAVCFKIFGTDTIAAGASALLLCRHTSSLPAHQEIAGSRTVAFHLSDHLLARRLYFTAFRDDGTNGTFYGPLGLSVAESPEAGHFSLCGAVAGLFYLTRYNAIIFLPLCLYLWWSSGRIKRKRCNSPLSGQLLLITLALAQLPGRGELFSLQSYEPAMFTASYPAYTLYMPQIIMLRIYSATSGGK